MLSWCEIRWVRKFWYQNLLLFWSLLCCFLTTKVKCASLENHVTFKTPGLSSGSVLYSLFHPPRVADLHFIWKQCQVMTTDYPCSTGWDLPLCYAKRLTLSLWLLVISSRAAPSIFSVRTDAISLCRFASLLQTLRVSWNCLIIGRRCLPKAQYEQKILNDILTLKKHKNRKKNKRVL
jgi:hypothetical protein